MNIHFTPEALNDLTRLREFIAVKDPAAARRAADTIQSGIVRLKQFPQMGVAVLRPPEPKKIRDLFIGEYTIRYLVGVSEIVVLRIWHDKESGRSDQASDF